MGKSQEDGAALEESKHAVSQEVAIITGGASGIGETYTRVLANSGRRVVIADLNDDAGKRVTQELRSTGKQVLFAKADVSNSTDCEGVVDQCMSQFGRLDILINNAALYRNIGGKVPLEQIEESQWDRMMAVNVKGCWLMMRASIPTMKAAGRGKIINIASSVFHIGVGGFAHYVASKGAVIGLTRSAARELGSHGINVNAIAPGLVANEASKEVNSEEYMQKAHLARSIVRQMEPEDLSGIVLYLSGTESDFVTGQTFVVDGGIVMV